MKYTWSGYIITALMEVALGAVSLLLLIPFAFLFEGPAFGQGIPALITNWLNWTMVALPIAAVFSFLIGLLPMALHRRRLARAILLGLPAVLCLLSILLFFGALIAAGLSNH